MPNELEGKMDERLEVTSDGLALEHPPFSNRVIERFLTGELDGPELETFQTALESNQELNAYVANRQADKRAFEQLRPAPRFESLPDTKRGRAWRWWFGAVPVGLAAVAVLLFVAVPSSPGSTPRISARGVVDESATLTVKRGTRLFILEEQGKRNSKSQTLLRKGDALRVELAGQSGRTVLVALQSQTSNTVHVEADMNEQKWVQQSSLILDGALGQERLVVVSVPPLQAAIVKAQLERGDIPEHAHVWSINKEPKP